ncbi:antigen 5 like allergen Cul n 1-like [Anastrepha ludens]|uniref:antigen 5 like allergen Cul n 1-like n=1 Tax=Anastrepha ludens TaxID=28586 RepID=UPI0023B112DA|nr:antigen 5 like allergen Cul n 1-like [Anastrepha ludens]
MQLKFTFLAFLLGTFEIISATNYCDSSLCSSSKHIACNNNGNFASSCKSPSLVTLTQANRNAIVNAHNVKRNLVAGGGTNLKPACRMATMQWDDELAALAALNVKQCQMKHDACHNTDAFKYSGQNLAWITFYGTPDVAKLAQHSIDMWYNEIKDTKLAYINAYPNNYQGLTIGHFTVMVADRNIRVGCAASTYAVSGKSYKAFLMACNYATTNMINFPIYKACATAASNCKKGTNADFPNLCSKSEVFAVNKWF